MKKISLLSLFLLLFINVRAGSTPANSWGIRSYASLSASGCGAYFTPAVFFRHNRNLFAAGPVVSNEYRCNGIHAGYEYLLAGNDPSMPKGSYHGRLGLFTFANFAYRDAAKLSSQTLLLAQDASTGDLGPPVTEVRSKIFEGYIGLGMKVQVFERLQWAASIGFGGFVSPDCPAYVYHERGIGMLWRTGLYLNLGRGRSASF